MKLKDKVCKVNDNIAIHRYSNGYMVDAGGEDENGDWKNVKVVCTSLDEVIELIKEYDSMPLN